MLSVRLCSCSHKDGYETFSSWKRVWTSNGKSEPSLKAFMADQELPYWVQCTKADCGKWRQLSKDTHLSATLASSYRCGMKLNSSKVEGSDACSQPEDLRVAGVTDSWWLSMLILPPLFKDSPATPFLSCYYPDCVGMSPSASPSNHPPVPGLAPYFQPFYQPNECGKALCVRPDMMELDELYEFPEFSRDPTMYLALRNLVLAAWSRDCKEVLTLQKCAPHVIVRGLVRVRCVQELDRVLYFMSRKGLINTGALQIKWPLLPESQHNKVLVIGAGAAGLAAARQLQNFGMQVVVLEARERIGGRVWDDASLGVTVGCGAQIVNGCVNNPIALMCEQLGLRMHTLGVRCELIQEGGRVTDTALDKRMDFHFNAVLDAVSEWRKDKSQSQDAPLGAVCLQVQHVDYSGEGVTVTSRCGSRWSAQKVLVTVPLALLQKNIIGFSPPLPDRKLKAIHSLGAGVIEKVALQFPTRFWDSKIQGADYFGHIPPCPEKRGLFSVFYDMCPQGDECVLMTVVTGEALSLLRDLQDSQVVDLCMSVLRELFQEQEVPDPLRFLVTRWSRDPWAQMSYSFVKTGGSGEAYDIIAEDVQGKLFFAGEATNRHFPQTVTGAYLSGVREASKIAAL
uniref:[histone-H3]-N(6),N(6)-dimethyl-L-lysine(4) FAD-dependent demethylase n=1 Tax=Sinocyclocheilus anshuiensis TaxID=1608454 RepID=A0A671MBB0_9TELE